MRVAFRIACKEAQSLLRAGSLVVAAGILSVLMVACLLVAQSTKAASERERTEMQARSRKQWESHRNVDPHSAAHYGIWVYKPITALATLDPGLDPYVGVSSHLVAHEASRVLGAPVAGTNRYTNWAEPTAAAIVLLLFPLVVIVAGAGAVVDERTGGTLRQTLAEGASRPAIALGKLVGILGTFLLLLLPAAVLAGFLAARDGDPRSAVLWALAGLLYAVIWAGITVAASSVAPGRPAALMALLALYALAVLAVPRLSIDQARSKFPTPPAPELDRAARAAFDRAFKARGTYDEQHKARVARLLKQYGGTTERDLKVNPDGFSMDENEALNDLTRDSVYAPVERDLARQDDLIARAPSPASAFSATSARLAGTDGDAQRRFARAVELYRRDWVHRLNMYLALHTRPGQYDDAPPEAFRSIPPFRYEPSPPAVGDGLVRLAMWASVSLVLAFVSAAVARLEAA